ncbi:uncharacterized protein LOC142337082 isoform X2 [Convolutriloba macropyga]|uniref:uncharacterized protein LOC142337082 isoform X2 n=1 Tax=Convolutriloba macropyga TaxID=536237 RepID=UPI003F51C4CD
MSFKTNGDGQADLINVGSSAGKVDPMMDIRSSRKKGSSTPKSHRTPINEKTTSRSKAGTMGGSTSMMSGSLMRTDPSHELTFSHDPSQNQSPNLNHSPADALTRKTTTTTLLPTLGEHDPQDEGDGYVEASTQMQRSQSQTPQGSSQPDVNRLSQLQEEADPNTDDKRGDENEEVEDDNKGYIDLLLDDLGVDEPENSMELSGDPIDGPWLDQTLPLPKQDTAYDLRDLGKAPKRPKRKADEQWKPAKSVNEIRCQTVKENETVLSATDDSIERKLAASYDPGHTALEEKYKPRKEQTAGEGSEVEKKNSDGGEGKDKKAADVDQPADEKEVPKKQGNQEQDDIGKKESGEPGEDGEAVGELVEWEDKENEGTTTKSPLTPSAGNSEEVEIEEQKEERETGKENEENLQTGTQYPNTSYSPSRSRKYSRTPPKSGHRSSKKRRTDPTYGTLSVAKQKKSRTSRRSSRVQKHSSDTSRLSTTPTKKTKRTSGYSSSSSSRTRLNTSLSGGSKSYSGSGYYIDHHRDKRDLSKYRTHENRSLSPPANFLDEREGRKSRSKKQHTATLKYGEQAGAYKKGSSKRHPRERYTSEGPFYGSKSNKQKLDRNRSRRAGTGSPTKIGKCQHPPQDSEAVLRRLDRIARGIERLENNLAEKGGSKSSPPQIPLTSSASQPVEGALFPAGTLITSSEQTGMCRLIFAYCF